MTIELKERNFFVYKIISCPIRVDILDVYSNLEKCIMVLANLASIYVKAWYLCKGNLVNSNVVVEFKYCNSYVEKLYEIFCESDIFL